jgi:hypothetical protein
MAEKTHSRLAPAQPIAQGKLVEESEKIVIIQAVKMIVTLQPQASEIEAGSHASQSVIGLKEYGLMPQTRKFVSHCQAHGASPNDGDLGMSQ